MVIQIVTNTKQESQANAKVSVQQQSVYEGLQRRQINGRNMIVEKYTQYVTTLSLTIRVDLHLFSCCCLPNLRNSAKFSENSNPQQFNVIKDHRSLCAANGICKFFLLIVNSNFGHPTFFEILTYLARKQLVFSTHPLFDAPQRRNALQYQRNLYTAGKQI